MPSACFGRCPASNLGINSVFTSKIRLFLICPRLLLVGSTELFFFQNSGPKLACPGICIHTSLDLLFFFTPSHYSPRWSPVPTIISIMDLGFLQNPEQFTAKDFNQLKNWTAYSARHAAKIIAISQYTKKILLVPITNYPKM